MVPAGYATSMRRRISAFVYSIRRMAEYPLRGMKDWIMQRESGLHSVILMII